MSGHLISGTIYLQGLKKTTNNLSRASPSFRLDSNWAHLR